MNCRERGKGMLNIFGALYDLFVNFMVTELAQFCVVALVLAAVVHSLLLAWR